MEMLTIFLFSLYQLRCPPSSSSCYRSIAASCCRRTTVILPRPTGISYHYGSELAISRLSSAPPPALVPLWPHLPPTQRRSPFSPHPTSPYLVLRHYHLSSAIDHRTLHLRSINLKQRNNRLRQIPLPLPPNLPPPPPLLALQTRIANRVSSQSPPHDPRKLRARQDACESQRFETQPPAGTSLPLL